MTELPNTITLDRAADGIVTLTMDDPSGSANVMNDAHRESMHRAVEQLTRERDGLAGVIVTSGKKTFFAGGDLSRLNSVTRETAEQFFGAGQSLKADMRQLETLGVPVVAVLNGAALGGGLEIALACHHRIAVDAPGSVFGLPEVTLGLLPGGGGVTRTVRMFGIVDALMKVLLEGKQFRPAQALELGLVDEVVASTDEAMRSARAWIAANPEATQPWDVQGYRMPGGLPTSGGLASILPSFPANLQKQLKGAPYPAPKAIMSAAVEGALVDFDTATRIESRYLTELTVGQTSKNMIQAFFWDLQAIKKGASRPSDVEPRAARKVAVLGAGMMGAGIAYSLAKVGVEVVLKDVSSEAAARGKTYSEALVAKGIQRGSVTKDKGDALLSRITATGDASDVAGCDVVIEAVFEDPKLKQAVFAEVIEHLAPDALLCSNTSTLPITGLASGVARPADFLGLHFFSPVDKMPLVEIIRGQQTSDVALARAYDLVLQLRKTPIVVQDSRGFFTSRVIGTFINEGLAMLAEGVNPVAIERAATQIGFPVGPLQISDELNLELMKRIRVATRDAMGEDYVRHSSEDVIDTMIDKGRASRKAGAGFYDYVDGKRDRLWTGLAESFPVSGQQPPFADIQERMTFVEALETVKCFDEGVLNSAADANIGSIMGIGVPAWTGGVVQYVEGYPGGVAGFVARADELRAAYGDQFDVPKSLRDRATQQTKVSA